MNLEKTINKNTFNMSSAIRNANPLLPSDPTKTDHPEQEQQQQDSPSTPLSSILGNPKQKLTTQFKRAMTLMKQQNEPSNDFPSSSSSLPITAYTDKPLDSTILTSLIEEPIKQKDSFESAGQISTSSASTPKSQSFVHIKSQPMHSPSNQLLSRISADSNNPSSTTILTIDPPIIRSNNPNSPSARMVKQSLQQIHSSILQTMHQHNPISPQTSSSATLSPTPTSSSSTMGTGEVAILETIL
jgi:hypothetical protein